MTLAREKRTHQRGYALFASDYLSAEVAVSRIKDTKEQRCLTEEVPSSLGRLMYAIPSASGAGAGLRSAIEGSGVVIRNDEMYFVSAISSCSKIKSRSSMSKARRRVSLTQPIVSG